MSPPYGTIKAHLNNHDKMADGGSNWWDNLFQTAKEKGSSVLEFMKKDLDEFTNTIQQETSTLMSSTAASLREKLHIDEEESTANVVKRSVSGIIGSVSNALVLPKEPNEDEAFVIKDSKPVILNRLELELLLVQRDASTYLEEPCDQEDYEAWLSTFDLESKRGELAELMASHTEVRALYKEMVPSHVSHIVFWHRYFYNVDQILKAEERRLASMKQTDSSKKDSDLPFDEDDEISQRALTTQETDRILDDYQRECEEMEARASQANLRTSMSEFSISHELAAANFRQDPTSTYDSTASNKSNKTPDSLPAKAPTEIARQEELPIVADTDSANSQTKTNASEKVTLDSSSSNSSKVSDGSTFDDEWVKDFDVPVTDEDVQRVLQQQAHNASLITTEPGKQEEDWEKWQ